MRHPKQGRSPRDLIGSIALGLSLIWLLALTGCTTVNASSARRLSEQALGATSALAQGLDGVRADLQTYVEGQALLAQLTGRPPLAPQELCSLQSVQESLRLRLMALAKLQVAYEQLRSIAAGDTWAADAPIVNEYLTDFDPSEIPGDPPLATGCPQGATNPANAANAPPRRDLAVAPEKVSPPRGLGLSQSKTLKLGSERIRALVERLLDVLERERPLIESVRRQLLESQKRIALALLSRELLGAGPLLGPQLERLGVRWDDWAYLEHRAKASKDQKDAVQAALIALLEQRAAYRLANQATLYEQQLKILRALGRLHLRLEAGQPFGVRDLAQLVAPVLRSASSAAPTTTVPVRGP